MDITRTLQNLVHQSTSLRLEPVRVEPAALRAWSDGQLLEALVVRKEGNQLTLRTPNLDLTVRTPLPLEAGQRLTLQVARDVHGKLELRVKELPEPVRNEVLLRALRTALPQQTALAPVLRSVAALAEDALIPEPVRQAARSLLAVTRTPEQLASAGGLAAAVRESGIWQEARLASGEVPSNDLKTILLRLAAQIRQALQQPANWQSARRSASQPEAQPGAQATSGRAPPPPTPGPGNSTPVSTPSHGAARSVPAQSIATQSVPARLAPEQPLPNRTAPPQAPPTRSGPQPPLPNRPTPGPSSTAEPAPRDRPATAGGKAEPSTPTGATEPRNTIELLRNLLKNTEGALARVQFQQLQTHGQQQQRDEPAWLFQLPVQTPDGFSELELRIRRGGHQGDAGEGSWNAMLTIDGGDYGPIRALVSLSGGRVSTLFRAREDATSQLIDEHIEALRERLLAAGLTVGQLDNIPGMPDESEEAPLFGDGLLREKA